MISDRISNDISPQMKILNTVIPILMHFCSLVLDWSLASRIKPHIVQQNVTYCSIWQDILSQIFEVIQSDVTLQNQVH